jgi:hypothetical protein
MHLFKLLLSLGLLATSAAACAQYRTCACIGNATNKEDGRVSYLACQLYAELHGFDSTFDQLKGVWMFLFRLMIWIGQFS